MKRVLLVVFAVSLGVRLLLYWLPARSPGEAIAAVDCADYFQMGRNLAWHGVFSRSTEPPYHRVVDRTPLYPLGLAAALKLGGAEESALRGVIVFQQLLGAATAVLGAWVVFLLMRDLRWAAVGGLLVGLEPYGIRYGMMIWTEPSFLFLAVLAVGLLVRHFQDHAPCSRYLLASGVVFALAALTRPVGQQVALVAVPVGLLLDGRFPWRARLVKSLLPFLLAYGVVVGPWVVRNVAGFGVWGLSTGAEAAAFIAAARVDAAVKAAPRTPLPADMAASERSLFEEWWEEFRTRHCAGAALDPAGLRPTAHMWGGAESVPEPMTGAWVAYVNAKSKALLREHFGLYWSASARMCLHMLLGFNKDILCRILNVDPSGQRTAEALREFLRGRFKQGARQLAGLRGIEWLGLFWSAMYAVPVSLLALAGLGWLAWRRSLALAALLGLILAILVVLAAFGVSLSYQSSRYVLPARPFLIVLAVVGLRAMLTLGGEKQGG